MESGQAEFIITGIGIEALTNRIDFTAVLAIHDPQWYAAYSSDINCGDEGTEIRMISLQANGLPEFVSTETLSAMSELALLRAESILNSTG